MARAGASGIGRRCGALGPARHGHRRSVHRVVDAQRVPADRLRVHCSLKGRPRRGCGCRIAKDASAPKDWDEASAPQAPYGELTRLPVLERS